MNKKHKIIVITILITVILGALCTIWHLNRSLFDGGLEVLIYMIGYGEESFAPVVNFVLAILGVVFITLFTAYLTSVFLEYKNQIKTQTNLVIDLDESKTASLNIKVGKWNLFDVHVKMIYSCNDRFYTEELYFPYLESKKARELKFHFSEGDAIFWYFRNFLSNSPRNETLILRIDYVNEKNNQSYSLTRRYSYNDSSIIFKTQKTDSELKEYFCNEYFELNLAEVSPICAENIELTPNCENAPFAFELNKALKAKVEIKNNSNDSFGMALFRRPFGSDWTKYFDMGLNVLIDICVTGNSEFHIEIKNENKEPLHDIALENTTKIQHVSIPLSEFRREDLSNITELCFTAKRNNYSAQKTTGEFYVLQCAMTK